jgi:hypothetical protein
MQMPIQDAPVLAKPDCLAWYTGDACDQAIQRYNQAQEQQRLQDWRIQVTAGFQKHIAEQQNQIAAQQAQIQVLQSRIESQTTEALRSEARTQALLDGTGAALGVVFAFLLVVLAFRRLTRGSAVLKGEQERTASA